MEPLAKDVFFGENAEVAKGFDVIDVDDVHSVIDFCA